jgi:hypothetical protein
MPKSRLFRRASIGLSFAGAAVSLGFGTDAASAAPSPFEGLPATCGAGWGEVVLVSPGNGPFTPAFIMTATGESNALLVPYEVDYVITVDGVTTSTSASKQAPLPADSVECTFDHTFHFGSVTYRIQGATIGTVVGQPTP